MTRRVPARLSESGETLAELLVAIAIMGLAIVVIVGGLGDAIISSTVHRGHTTADGLVRTAAECVKSRDLVYAANGNYTAACGASGVTISAQWWNGDSPPTFSATPNSNGLQSITVAGTSNRGAQSVVVLKRIT